ncbi:MAG: immunoglobulin-like domain-containing protein [Pirellulales bacterium]
MNLPNTPWGKRASLALVIGLAMAAQAAAQAPLEVTVNGPNPMTLECGVDSYRELGATISGGSRPYELEISGSVNTRRPGRYRITYTATDSSTPEQTATAVRIVIVADTIAPTVNASVARSMLWPPNHNLINVGLRARVSDACDPDPAIDVMVFGDEDDEEATGDGRHSPDAKNIALGSLRLRSERKGNADGRVYLVLVTATDESGNVGFDCATVVVPHDRSRRSVQSVRDQAARAERLCPAFAAFATGNGPLPGGYFIIGDGPVLGPKQ